MKILIIVLLVFFSINCFPMCATGGGAFFSINVVIKNMEDAIKIEPKNNNNYLILSQAYSVASLLDEVEVQQSKGKIDSLGGACGGGPSILFWNNTGKKNLMPLDILRNPLNHTPLLLNSTPMMEDFT